MEAIRPPRAAAPRMRARGSGCSMGSCPAAGAARARAPRPFPWSAQPLSCCDLRYAYLLRLVPHSPLRLQLGALAVRSNGADGEQGLQQHDPAGPCAKTAVSNLFTFWDGNRPLREVPTVWIPHILHVAVTDHLHAGSLQQTASVLQIHPNTNKRPRRRASSRRRTHTHPHPYPTSPPSRACLPSLRHGARACARAECAEEHQE